MLAGVENTRIFVQLTDEEKAELEDLRKEYSASMSRFVRELIIVPYLRERQGKKKMVQKR